MSTKEGKRGCQVFVKFWVCGFCEQVCFEGATRGSVAENVTAYLATDSRLRPDGSRFCPTRSERATRLTLR